MDQMSQQRHEPFHSERDTNNSCPLVTAFGNATSLDSHYILGAYDNDMMHGMTQNNRIQHHPNVFRGVTSAANRYYCGMNPSTSAAMSRNDQHFNASVSFSAAPPNARHTENGISTMPHCSSWSRSLESMMVNGHNHLVRRNYSGQHFQPVAPPWLNQQLNSNSNGSHALATHQSLPMHYIQAPIANGTSLRNAGMGLPRHNDNDGCRGGQVFLYPPLVHPQYHSFHHQTQPLHEIRGPSINFHPLVTAASHRIPTNPPRSSSVLISHVDPVAIIHVGIHRLRETTLRHQNHPPLPSFHIQDDVSLPSGNHSDMGWDSEDMSYEEITAIADRIVKESAARIEEMITSQMKTNTYTLPTNLEEANFEEKEPDPCVICQDEYMNQDKIGILRCGHEYHADCLRKWLYEQNACPLCRAEALTPGEKDDEKQ